MQLTGGYRPKLNVATKAGMFTPFLGPKKPKKISMCVGSIPRWRFGKRRKGYLFIHAGHIMSYLY